MDALSRNVRDTKRQVYFKFYKINVGRRENIDLRTWKSLQYTVVIESDSDTPRKNETDREIKNNKQGENERASRSTGREGDNQIVTLKIKVTFRFNYSQFYVLETLSKKKEYNISSVCPSSY